MTPMPPRELLAAPANVVGTGDAVFVSAAPAAVLVLPCFSNTKLTLGRPVPKGLLGAEPVGYGALVGTTVAVDCTSMTVLYNVVVIFFVVCKMVLEATSLAPPVEIALTGTEVAAASDTGHTVV